MPEENGSLDASPCTTFAAPALERSIVQNLWLYSRLVTLCARRASAAVAAPAPAPISNTRSPTSIPPRIAGSTRCCVIPCQNREAQNQFSSLFIARIMTQQARHPPDSGASARHPTNQLITIRYNNPLRCPPNQPPPKSRTTTPLKPSGKPSPISTPPKSPRIAPFATPSA